MTEIVQNLLMWCQWNFESLQRHCVLVSAEDDARYCRTISRRYHSSTEEIVFHFFILHSRCETMSYKNCNYHLEVVIPMKKVNQLSISINNTNKLCSTFSSFLLQIKNENYLLLKKIVSVQLSNHLKNVSLLWIPFVTFELNFVRNECKSDMMYTRQDYDIFRDFHLASIWKPTKSRH